MTETQFLEACARGVGGVYSLRGTTIVAWVDEHCSPRFPILRGEGTTIAEALANLTPKVSS